MRAVSKEQAWERRLQRIGEWVDAIEDGRGTEGLEEARVTEVRLLTNQRDTGDTLLVVKASNKTGDWVGFVGARNMGEALLAWRQRDGAKGLTWRPDRPWQG